MSPRQRRGLAEHLIKKHQVSEVRSCRAVGMSRSGFRHQARKPDDQEILDELQTIAESKPRWGFKKMNAYLKNQGFCWNHKRIYRVILRDETEFTCQTKETFSKQGT